MLEQIWSRLLNRRRRTKLARGDSMRDLPDWLNSLKFWWKGKLQPLKQPAFGSRVFLYRDQKWNPGGTMCSHISRRTEIAKLDGSLPSDQQADDTEDDFWSTSGKSSTCRQKGHSRYHSCTLTTLDVLLASTTMGS